MNAGDEKNEQAPETPTEGDAIGTYTFAADVYDPTPGIQQQKKKEKEKSADEDEPNYIYTWG